MVVKNSGNRESQSHQYFMKRQQQTAPPPPLKARSEENYEVKIELSQAPICLRWLSPLISLRKAPQITVKTSAHKFQHTPSFFCRKQQCKRYEMQTQNAISYQLVSPTKLNLSHKTNKDYSNIHGTQK